MPIRNPERAILKLTGEVHALYMTLQALVKAHLNPSILSNELSVAEQHGLAGLEPYPIDDAVIVAFQDAFAGIRRALAANPLYSQNRQP